MIYIIPKLRWKESLENTATLHSSIYKSKPSTFTKYIAYTKANLQHLHNIFGFKSVKLVKPKGKDCQVFKRNK